LRNEIEVTATFKHKKVDLVKQGFDPAATNDAVYFDNPQAGAFERLDRTLYDRILDGRIRL
jgi:fatty-acyl-CoA synthase